MLPTVQQTNFAGGEWAPSLSGRTSLEKYSTAVDTMVNFFPYPHGGASNRGGTKYLGEVKDSDKDVRLLKFDFSVTQSYIIELGDLYMRLFADGGQVVGAAGNGWYANKDSGGTVWTESGSGVKEFYLSDAPGVKVYYNTPAALTVAIRADGTLLTAGTVGSLAAGEWGLGAADGQTKGDAIYVRLVDDADPDSKSETYIEMLAVADGDPYELTLPYVEADIWGVKTTQSADSLYIFHKGYPPGKIVRWGHAFHIYVPITFESFTNTPYSVSGPGTDYDFAVTAVQVNGDESIAGTGTASNGNTLTWSHITTSGKSYYYNIYVDYTKSGNFGWIGQARDKTFDLPSSSITPDYTFNPPTVNRNPFDDTDLYPAVGAFFEQRLVMARTNEEPQTLQGSVVGSFENFNQKAPIKDDDAYNFTISSQQINEIRWLVPLNKLMIGTSGSEWQMTNGSNADAVTPSNVLIRRQSLYGSSNVEPIVIGSSIIFIEASNKVVRDLSYSLEADSYKGGDLTIMANHLFNGFELIDWAYQRNPNSVMWAVRNDGTLLGLTYLKEHDISGWHRHETDGKFKSVRVLRDISDGADDLYAIVERVIDGATVKYVELFFDRLKKRDDFVYDVQDAYFVDCGLSLDSPLTISAATKADPVVLTITDHGLSNGDPIDIVEVEGMTELNGNRYWVANQATNTVELTDIDGNAVDGTAFTTYTANGKARKAVTAISGLDHLEGEAVSVLANGSVAAGLTVASGAITLPRASSRVHVGLPYTCNLGTLNLEYGTKAGTAQDKYRAVSSVMVRLDNTRSLFVGPDVDNLDEVYFREDEDYNEPTHIFTGDKEISIEPGPSLQSKVFMQVVDPVPATILAVMARMETGDA